MSKDRLFRRINKMFWHTARDDTMFTSIRLHIYAFASGEKAPKSKYVRKKVDPNTSPKQKLVQASKGTRLKLKAKVDKSDKKKQRVVKEPKLKLAVYLDEEEDDEVTKELYDDVNVNLGNEDTDMTNVDQVDRYMDNKFREAINKAILAQNLDCRQEAQDEKNAYIELILQSCDRGKMSPESVEVAVLTGLSAQPMSTYEADAIIPIESYNTNKDLFDSYGEVFSLKRTRDDSDKDRDPSAGSDRGKKRRKSSKDAESSRDSRRASYTEINDEYNPVDKEGLSKADWFKENLSEAPTTDPDWRYRQVAFSKEVDADSKKFFGWKEYENDSQATGDGQYELCRITSCDTKVFSYEDWDILLEPTINMYLGRKIVTYRFTLTVLSALRCSDYRGTVVVTYRIDDDKALSSIYVVYSITVHAGRYRRIRALLLSKDTKKHDHNAVS
ncbi:hypothetical protein Tco_0115645 [Tanacetum coccineum]